MDHRRPVLFKFGVFRYGLWFSPCLFSYYHLEFYTCICAAVVDTCTDESSVFGGVAADERTDKQTDPFCVYRRADVCRNGEHTRTRVGIRVGRGQ